MATIKLMHAKLHRVRVTEANPHYVGSITIDQELLIQVGILPLEEVEIVNIDNGNRWSTYVLPGEAGKRQICPNGGGALLSQPGDTLIIWANEERDRAEVLQHGHQALVLLADENNCPQEVFCQTLTPKEETVEYNGYQVIDSTLFSGNLGDH
ncbi:aspartate 1-decarboxylase [Aetokthonos hydrillicola Thurmond2011]|jgi:aspartate 1-decarboxylase|uniref:Aspartate 1-decarboxylase n=1 Tax=Aetokthonos hydrillicola Thurmond2011 TaxID=2712845 RepID=A0AAP5I4G9_9CYAN|nr:aspartate 1-decarboxylase [Aetokthonos hydrillicola]MBO3460930.1 aspartate 1-decarboxylase [Aetokthonos hydrillicola CCALA 1050]MBW4586479.1 aspartate 1-decarboxylase [Aetokthonos hydrillicola CCALA 1050]MDR9893577.1 aspartate 1-decarboxylase [Aetokthonos hydrillicola Thurmond2011]